MYSICSSRPKCFDQMRADVAAAAAVVPVANHIDLSVVNCWLSEVSQVECPDFAAAAAVVFYVVAPMLVFLHLLADLVLNYARSCVDLRVKESGGAFEFGPRSQLMSARCRSPCHGQCLRR